MSDKELNVFFFGVAVGAVLALFVLSYVQNKDNPITEHCLNGIMYYEINNNYVTAYDEVTLNVKRCVE